MKLPSLSGTGPTKGKPSALVVCTGRLSVRGVACVDGLRRSRGAQAHPTSFIFKKTLTPRPGSTLLVLLAKFSLIRSRPVYNVRCGPGLEELRHTGNVIVLVIVSLGRIWHVDQELPRTAYHNCVVRRWNLVVVVLWQVNISAQIWSRICLHATRIAQGWMFV